MPKRVSPIRISRKSQHAEEPSLQRDFTHFSEFAGADCNLVPMPEWTRDEDSLLVQCVLLHGVKWKRIAKSFPSRTPHGIRCRYARLTQTNASASGKNKCSKCGQIKRGHVCKAINESIHGHETADEELNALMHAVFDKHIDNELCDDGAEMSSVSVC